MPRQLQKPPYNSKYHHNISQTQLIKKFSQFMALQAQNNPIPRDTDSFYNQLKDGLCHGFSLTYSYMVAIGKEQWWNECLEHLARWQGTEMELNIPLSLAQANSKKTVLLSELFTRAINYIQFHQVDSCDIPFFNEQMQYDLTNPQNQESVSFEAHEKKLQKQHTAGGYFSQEALCSLIQEDYFKTPCLFLVSIQPPEKRDAHTIALYYQSSDKVWCIYDPNRREGIREFPSKKAVTSHILSQYTPNLQLLYATLDNSQLAKENSDYFKTTYNLIYQSSPEILLQSSGYPSDANQQDIYSILKSIEGKLVSSDQTEINEVTSLLLSRTFSGDTLLISTLCFHPLFFKIITQAIKTNDTYNIVLQSLCTLNAFGASGLETLIKKTSLKKSLQLFLAVCKEGNTRKDLNFTELLSKILTFSTLEKQPIFRLVSISPMLIKQCLLSTIYSETLKKQLIECLTKKITGQLTGLEYLLKEQMASFTILVSQSNTHYQLREVIAAIITQQSYQHSINSPHPFTAEIFNKICGTIESHPKLMIAFSVYYDVVKASNTPIDKVIIEKMDSLRQQARYHRQMASRLIQELTTPLLTITQGSTYKQAWKEHARQTLSKNTHSSIQSLENLCQGSRYHEAYEHYLRNIDQFIIECFQNCHFNEERWSKIEQSYWQCTELKPKSSFSRFSLFRPSVTSNEMTESKKKIIALVDNYSHQQPLDDTSLLAKAKEKLQSANRHITHACGVFTIDFMTLVEKLIGLF